VDVFYKDVCFAEKNEYVRNFIKSISFLITDEASNHHMEITFVLRIA